MDRLVTGDRDSSMEDIKRCIEASIDAKTALRDDIQMLEKIEAVAGRIAVVYGNRGRVLFCGNGGSAADAQHFAAELSGRFRFDREPLDAQALHGNTSHLTAVANDYSYDDVYARLVKACGRKGDVLFGISTSGNSGNIVRAMQMANSIGMVTVGMTGSQGGEMRELSDYLFNVPSDDTPRIQEVHTLVGHIICELVERKVYWKEYEATR